MSFARIFSAQPIILDAQKIEIECDVSRGGLPSFNIVGLADRATEEAKDRINSAIKHSGFNPPKASNTKVVISLAPGHIKKSGTGFDVGMAISFLQSSGQIEGNFNKKLFIGELSLDGKIKSVKGLLPIVRSAISWGIEEIYIPTENVSEVSFIKEVNIFCAESLLDLIKHIRQDGEDRVLLNPINAKDVDLSSFKKEKLETNINEIHGQEQAKRALQIAITGGHNIAFFGPPGTGKSMLAQAARSLLPDLDQEEMLDVTSIYSSGGLLQEPVIWRPPFRAPHHTASYPAIVGGGNPTRPGEITLAHKGILFLDEFPEFDSRVIDSLRQPLENKKIKISRLNNTLDLPADFILIVAMNPCPCGYFGQTEKSCSCTAGSIQKYRRKISGPIIDRVDIWVNVPRIEIYKLLKEENSERGDSVREQIAVSREYFKLKMQKFEKNYSKVAEIKSKDIKNVCLMNKEAENILEQSARTLLLSGRAIHRVMKVAKTISIIDREEIILAKHILEALQYRKSIY